MDARSEEESAHRDRLGRAPDALLGELQSGLDGLRSLLSEIDAREAQLGLDTLRSIMSRFAKPEQRHDEETAA
jgi:hypothetical protein